MTTRRSLLAAFGVALPVLAFAATAQANTADVTGTQPHHKKGHKHATTASASSHKHHHHAGTMPASAPKPAAAPKPALPQS